MHLLDRKSQGEERACDDPRCSAQDNSGHRSDSERLMDSSLLREEIAGFGASLEGCADTREFAPWPRAISIALVLDPVTLG